MNPIELFKKDRTSIVLVQSSGSAESSFVVDTRIRGMVIVESAEEELEIITSLILLGVDIWTLEKFKMFIAGD